MVAFKAKYARMKQYLRPLMDDGWERLELGKKIERFRLSCLEQAPDLMETWDVMDRSGNFEWGDALAYCEAAIRWERGNVD